MTIIVTLAISLMLTYFTDLFLLRLPAQTLQHCDVNDDWSLLSFCYLLIVIVVDVMALLFLLEIVNNQLFWKILLISNYSIFPCSSLSGVPFEL